MIIQFVVITRGAERVAEVAARFTLDAMPGKQMAIDADLNAGLVSEEAARQRRRDIEREADFYGSMDGASKFVKGDAIAGLVISIINILGGIIIGVAQRGMAAGEATGLYSLLTVGGLVTIQPLLISTTATGIVVPGRPRRPSAAISLANCSRSRGYCGSPPCFSWGSPKSPDCPTCRSSRSVEQRTLSTAMHRAAARAEKVEAEARRQEELEDFRRPESALAVLHLDTLEIELGYALVALADRDGGDLPERVSVIRRQLASELGMVVPPIRIVDNIQLRPNTYVVRLRGVEVARGELFMDRYLSMNPGQEDQAIDGIPTREPAFGLPALWIGQDSREQAELSGYTVVDPPSVMATHLTEVIKQHAHELLGRQETQALLDTIKQRSPVVVEELVPNLMTLGEVQKVLQNLLREGVTIRDLETILETLADLARSTKDLDVLTEQVRQAMSRMLSKTAAGESEILRVITLDPALEEQIMAGVQHSETGTTLAVEPGLVRKMLASLAEQTQRLADRGYLPVVLCSPLVRLYFKRLTERVARKLTVLSYSELDPDLQVEALGVVSLA